jgi:hypothetical protein
VPTDLEDLVGRDGETSGFRLRMKEVFLAKHARRRWFPATAGHDVFFGGSNLTSESHVRHIQQSYSRRLL